MVHFLLRKKGINKKFYESRSDEHVIKKGVAFIIKGSLNIRAVKRLNLYLVERGFFLFNEGILKIKQNDARRLIK